MATPLFPSNILPPSQQGYRVKKPREVITSNLDGGASRARRDKVGASYVVQASWACTPDQYTAISGFFRDRLQSRVRIFRIPLKIDTPSLVPYRVRLMDDPEELVDNQGLLHVVNATLEVIPNPMVSFGLVLQRVADERVIAGNNPDFTPTIMNQFPVARQVMLTGCKGTASGVALNLDGTYTILSKPSADIIVLNNAAAVNAQWTTLAGTVAQALFPDTNAGACILLPE